MAEAALSDHIQVTWRTDFRSTTEICEHIVPGLVHPAGGGADDQIPFPVQCTEQNPVFVDVQYVDPFQPDVDEYTDLN